MQVFLLLLNQSLHTFLEAMMKLFGFFGLNVLLLVTQSYTSKAKSVPVGLPSCCTCCEDYKKTQVEEFSTLMHEALDMIDQSLHANFVIDQQLFTNTSKSNSLKSYEEYLQSMLAQQSVSNQVMFNATDGNDSGYVRIK